MSPILERLTGAQLRWEDHDGHRWLTPVALACLAIAVLLAVVGLPPVSIHGPLHFAGIMDPLCGMTRGTAAAVRGDLAAAVRFNPASPLVPLAGIASLARWAYGRGSGRWVTARFVARPLPVALAMIATVALEVNQQLHADLLAG